MTPQAAAAIGVCTELDFGNTEVVSQEYGKSSRVVFKTEAEDGGTVTRLLPDVLSFRKRPAARNPRPWINGALTAGAAAVAVRRLRRRTTESVTSKVCR